MRSKTEDIVFGQNKLENLERDKYSEHIYREKLEFLKKIGLTSLKKPNFGKLSQYFQSQILDNITYEISIHLNQKIGLIEITTSESEIKSYKDSQSVILSYITPNQIHFHIEIQVVMENGQNELLIDCKLKSDFDGALFRYSLIDYESINNLEYSEIEEEISFQDFSTLLPMEERIQIQLNTLNPTPKTVNKIIEIIIIFLPFLIEYFYTPMETNHSELSVVSFHCTS